MLDILIVEDNQDLALGLRNNLEIEGYSVECVYDGQQGIDFLSTQPVQLIILDLMMPNLNGYEFLKKMNSLADKPMILILSAKDTEIDKVTGLRSGADDFMTKPFGLMELVARVEALMRRKPDSPNDNNSKSPSTLSILDIQIKQDARQVFKNSQEIILTPKEFDLLVYLLKNKGQVISRLALMKQVWGHCAAIESRTVDTHIGELRKKLECDPTNPKMIKTVRKVGYRIDC